MAIVVDTNIFIDLFEDDKKTIQFFKRHSEEIAFSAITETELLSGPECKDALVQEKILHLLARFKKIPVDNPLVQVAALYRRTYGIKTPDAIIAASAAIDGVVATRNKKDFKKIPGLKIITPQYNAGQPRPNQPRQQVS